MIYAFSNEQIFSEGLDRTKYELGYLRECSSSLKTEDSGGRDIISTFGRKLVMLDFILKIVVMNDEI